MAHSSNTGNRTFFTERDCYNCHHDMNQINVGEWVCPACGWVWRKVQVTLTRTRVVR